MIVKENSFQSSLIRTIKNLFPGCIVLKNDANYIQGIPDLLVLYGITWIALECKKSEKAAHQPNQDYYIEKMNEMSYATFVYPENVQQVLEDMKDYFYSINSKFKNNELTCDEINKINQSQAFINNVISSNINRTLHQA